MKVVFVSDLHSNLAALESIADCLRAADHVVCLGDLTGYYTHPNEVIHFVRDHNAQCILGNHDYFALRGCPNDLPESVRWGVAYTANHLTADNLKWLAALPLSWGGFIGERSMLLTHGAPWDPLHFYLYSDQPRLAELEEYVFDLVAFGHTHRQLLRLTQGPTILNPGSVGQSRDKVGCATAAVLDTDSMVIQLIERAYDTSPVVERALRAGAGPWISKHLR